MFPGRPSSRQYSAVIVSFVVVVIYIIASDILIAVVRIAIAVRRVEHPYLVSQHIRHGVVLEDTAPAGVGVSEVSYHVFVYVQIFLQEVLYLTAGRVGEIYVGMGLVEDPTGFSAVRG